MRLSAKAPIVIRGEEITHLDADGYKHLPRATALPDGKVLVTSNGAWRASDLSGVSVSSVFGRTGAVVAQTGDYTAAQVGAEPYAGVPAQTSFWRSTAAGVRAWVQLVAADITDLATTLSAYLTKSNPSFSGTLRQGATTRIDSSGGASFASLDVVGDASVGSIESVNGGKFGALAGEGNVFACANDDGVLYPQTPSQARALMAAAPIAGAEILIHSDFGRSATTDVWQSAFADNTASGLQFAANTTANGTKLIIEQALSIPADGGGATYQVYIGPQLTGEQAPSGSTYAIAIAPNIAGQNGTGTLRIEIELLGSGASITGHVTSTFSASGSNAPWVNIGTISVDGTQANSLDVRFNPDATTSYVIRRNRVRRVNP